MTSKDYSCTMSEFKDSNHAREQKLFHRAQSKIKTLDEKYNFQKFV